MIDLTVEEMVVIMSDQSAILTNHFITLKSTENIAEASAFNFDLERITASQIKVRQAILIKSRNAISRLQKAFDDALLGRGTRHQIAWNALIGKDDK